MKLLQQTPWMHFKQVTLKRKTESRNMFYNAGKKYIFNLKY